MCVEDLFVCMSQSYSGASCNHARSAPSWLLGGSASASVCHSDLVHINIPAIFFRGSQVFRLVLGQVRTEEKFLI